MMKGTLLAFLLLAIASGSGCAMCCTPYDDAYPTYGGKWQRTDRYHGRVGSAFSPAGAYVPQPTPAATPAPIIQPSP